MDILKNSTNFSCTSRVNRKLHRYRTASRSSGALSSDASSCGAPGGRSGRSCGCRRRTGRAWPPCASGSGASAHRSARTASRSLPTCTCTASHLQHSTHKRRCHLARLCTEQHCCEQGADTSSLFTALLSRPQTNSPFVFCSKFCS